MPYEDIAVSLDASDLNEARLETAIKMGAYGKPPLWERPFGGTSERRLANASMPFPMSH
ncbi:hypothetical protein ATER59S_00817 [Aquamicrobium terrae]